MRRTALLLGVIVALFALGCAEKSPTSAALEESAVDTPAAKLTVSSTKAAGLSSRRDRGEAPPSLHIASSALRFDQTLSQYGLEIDWRSISDSRCAEGATCIWEGEVAIEVDISKDGEDLGTFTLTLHPGDEDRAQVSTSTHEIRLLGVDPYPKLDEEVERSAYVASLGIARTSSPSRNGRLTISTDRSGGYYPPQKTDASLLPEPTAPSLAPLGGTQWHLQSFGPLGEENSLLSGTGITIDFGKDGQLHGSGGCNSYFGTFAIDEDGALSIGRLASTEMACLSPEGVMDQEMQFLKALPDVSTFTIEQEILTLLSDDGQQTFHLIAGD